MDQMDQRAPAREAPFGDRPRKMTIGAVCDTLRREFPDISISKIRYLEDQKLLSPRRTQGGYRLYSTADVTRLRTILRLQRDEFLPLRVIRQELAAGRTAPAQSEDSDDDDARPRRMAISSGPAERHSLDDVLEYSGADERLLRELEEYGVLSRKRNGGQGFDTVEREIVRTAAELSRFGVAARNLRVLRTSADREAVLIEQILGPALRSRNRDRRREAVDNLESLAAVMSQLKHLMLVRDLRKLVQE
jgi:DNA-binding transcriptional MerR regulator